MNKSNSSLDSYLILYAPNGSEVGRNDDFGGSTDASINNLSLSQNGRYRVVAKSYNGGSSGAYSISLSLQSGAPDPRQDAQVQLSGSFMLNGTAYFTIRVKNYGNVATPAIHPYIEGRDSANQLWRADGAQPASAVIQPGQTVTFQVQHTMWRAGRWTSSGIFLWNNSTSSYWKQLPAHVYSQQFSFDVIADEPARTLASGQSLAGNINPNSDEDTLYFDANQGQQASIRMTRNGSALDSYLILFAPNGAEVARDDDGGGGANSLIGISSLPQSGRYRLIAKSYNGGSGGAYTVNLILAAAVTCGDSQYRAEYFNNATLSGNPAFIRCESWPIDRNWGTGGPGTGVGSDNFSVRWTGRANINAGTYLFTARSSDGIRVWIGNTQIINAWRDRPYSEDRVTRSVQGGSYGIRVEYYERNESAAAYFRWDRTGAAAYP